MSRVLSFARRLFQTAYRAEGPSLAPLICLSFALLLAPGAALGADWAETWSGAPLAERIPAAVTQIIVVRAGADTEAARPAGEALVAALQRLPGILLVMDDAALGGVDGLSDGALVERAKIFPVEAVAVLRVFPSADGETAVLTFYAPSGEVLGALSAARREGALLATLATPFDPDPEAPPAPETAPVPEAAPAPSAGRNVSEATLDAVQAAIDSGAKAQEVYDAQSLVVVSLSTPVLIRLGVTGAYVKPREILALAGRDDLLDVYDAKRRNQRGVLIAAGVVGGIATGFGVASLAARGSPELRYDRILATSGVLYLAAGGVTLSALAVRPFPLDRDETLRLVRDYNEALKARLGIAARPAAPDLRLSAAAGPRGAGLTLRATF